MKVLTLWQPWASLCVIINPATGEPYKTIETRSWKPPASLIGRRIALHAAASENWREGHQVGDWLCYRTSKTHPARMYCRSHRPKVVALPLGAIVATCTLVDVVPIVDINDAESTAGRRLVPCQRLMLWGDERRAEADVTDQRPYGDFTPGRYAWLLANVVPVDPPVAFMGGQGLTKTWEPVA